MKPRVLIVDDDRAILEGLSMLLEENHETLTALDGEEALRILDREQIDIVILDMLMPVLDGAGVLREMSERGSSIPVIVISAHTDLQDRAQSLGAADAIAKPFDIAMLERKIAQLLEKKNSSPDDESGSTPLINRQSSGSSSSGFGFAPYSG
ncbi:MAG TPA: response regulator [Gammaproteobacteria bacterium]|nr:response regulator [Gammaproteobacteria bacterium]